MLLATRCPFCETVFRIQPQQLAARHGLVRCGHCLESFDASGSLFEIPVGGDFSNAVPVAASVAAGLTSGEASAADTGAASGSTADTRAAAATPAAAAATPAAATPAATPGAPGTTTPPTPSATPDTPAATPASRAATPSPARPEPPASSAPPSPARTPPNFSNPSWDPWTPNTGSPRENPLRYSGEHLPEASAAPGVTPRVPDEPAEPRLGPDPAEPTPSAAGRWKLADRAPAAEPPGRWKRADTEEPAEPTLSASAAPPPPPPPPGTAEPHLSAGGAAGAGGFADLPPPDGTPFAMTREVPARAPRRTGWRIVGVILALLLLALFAAQLAWWMRETVMVNWPGSLPLYERACSKLGCHVLPPRDIDGLQVEPSDLRQVDDPHHLELRMPLHNHFNVALAYPAIELTLLDQQNTPVLRRVLWPQDYVPPGTHIDAGLPAHTTQTMIVRLDTGNVVASNFRIEVFYP